MKRYLPFVIVVVVALATFGSGAILYRAKRPQLRNLPENQSVPAKGDQQSAHIRGNPDAPVTLEEFGDFECPPCGLLHPELKMIEREYGSRVRIIFREFPLVPTHAHALAAAHAVEAAGLHGNFW